jgi:2-methylcitrate dehydratase PrpD
MDAMRLIMEENRLTPGDIESVTIRAGRNVLGPIRFRIARTELEGKFSFAFLLSAIILRRRAGKEEFTDDFVSSPECQAMQERVATEFDQTIENMGWDRIRSRIDVRTRDGRDIVRWADENYRGGPHNPMSNAEIEVKFRNCAAGLLQETSIARLFDAVWAIEELDDAGELISLLSWR